VNVRNLVMCLPLLLAACSPSPGPPAPSADSADDNVIGAPLEQSLDKARSVEDLSSGRKGGLDEALDDAD
jgi:hypothetical protein